jgi:hypothetical protein
MVATSKARAAGTQAASEAAIAAARKNVPGLTKATLLFLESRE